MIDAWAAHYHRIEIVRAHRLAEDYCRGQSCGVTRFSARLIGSVNQFDPIDAEEAEHGA